MAALAPLASASKPLTPPETDAHSAEPGRLGGFDGRLLAFAVELLCWQIALLSELLYEIISVEQLIALHIASCLAILVSVRWRAGSVPIDGPHAVVVHMTVWSL